jgi:mono/diheme cytochrome c family protein
MVGRTATLFAIGALLAACSEGGSPSGSAESGGSTRPPAAKPKPTPEPEDIVAKGRQSYLSNCIACHNPDPKLDGALGPGVAGASLPLLEARVMRAEYPEGYKPKRDTRSMVAMPFLEKQIPALAAYLENEG